jgi:hypothetical protein
MKVLLDLDKLLAQGRITPEQYEELRLLGEERASNLILNILVGFGVWATAFGALAWLSSPLATLQIGLILLGLGIYLRLRWGRVWSLLARMLLLVGALTLAGGILTLSEGSVTGFLWVTAIFLGGAIIAKSSSLGALAALALSATVGAMTSYGGASYYLTIQQPTLTIALCSFLGWLSYLISQRVREDYQNLGITFARTCLFLVNFGFWVGSLWGDSLDKPRNSWEMGTNYGIGAEVFVIGWALALLGVGAWAYKQQKIWVVNTLAVFGVIHFYTQYLARLGANPFSLMLAGIIALSITLVLFRYNRRS